VSQVTLTAFLDGQIAIEGLATNEAQLPQVARFIFAGDYKDAALSAPAGATEGAPNVTAALVTEPGPETPALVYADAAEFLAGHVDRLAMGWIASRALRESYLQWATQRDLRPVDLFMWCGAARAFGLRAERRRPNGGKQERGWAGGRLLTDARQLRLMDGSGASYG
jgi:hypothetical protein